MMSIKIESLKEKSNLKVIWIVELNHQINIIQYFQPKKCLIDEIQMKAKVHQSKLNIIIQN